jgi:hypothetical protein
MNIHVTPLAERDALAFACNHDFHPQRFLPELSIYVIQWELTLASVLDNVEDRFGCSHLAYLGVLSMGDLPPFAGGLRAPFPWARVDGFPVP